MGNQEVRKAMSRIQDKEFDVNKLQWYLKAIWALHDYEKLKPFQEFLKLNGIEDWKAVHAGGTGMIDRIGVENDETRQE